VKISLLPGQLIATVEENWIDQNFDVDFGDIDEGEVNENKMITVESNFTIISQNKGQIKLQD
jgi:hypothetical protein